MRLCEDCGKEMELVPVRWCGSNAYIWKCLNDGNLAPVKTLEEMDVEAQIRHNYKNGGTYDSLNNEMYTEPEYPKYPGSPRNKY